jgi:hypothetical protein
MVLVYTGGDWTWFPSDPEPGWTPYGNWGFSRVFACGEQFDLSVPRRIGKVTYQNIGVNFSYDIFIGPPL